MAKVVACALCQRERPGTLHHLIPRTCHRNKWFQKRFSREQMQETVPLCRPCHSAVHKFVPREKDLGRHFNSLAALRRMPELQKFVTWVRKQR